MANRYLIIDKVRTIWWFQGWKLWWECYQIGIPWFRLI